MDFSTIYTAVDWSTVSAGILAVAALLAVVAATSKGARKLLGFIGR